MWVIVLISVTVYISLGLIGAWARSRVQQHQRSCLIRYGHENPNFSFHARFALYEPSFSMLDIKKAKALNSLRQPWSLVFNVDGFKNQKKEELDAVTLLVQRYNVYVTIQVLKQNILLDYYVIDNKQVDELLDRISVDPYLLPNSDQYSSIEVVKIDNIIVCRNTDTGIPICCSYEIPDHDSYLYIDNQLEFVKGEEVTKVAMSDRKQVNELIIYVAEQNRWLQCKS